jgi:hypothetical protein
VNVTIRTETSRLDGVRFVSVRIVAFMRAAGFAGVTPPNWIVLSQQSLARSNRIHAANPLRCSVRPRPLGAEPGSVDAPIF